MAGRKKSFFFCVDNPDIGERRKKGRMKNWGREDAVRRERREQIRVVWAGRWREKEKRELKGKKKERHECELD